MVLESDLRQVQLVELEILKFIDSICQKENIQYSLFFGTLLGAVRHQGFIPWDDDLDICMRRSEYDRFLRVCPKYLGDSYTLLNKDINCDFTQTFSKICKNDTLFIQEGIDYKSCHRGIFVDIFPLDNIPDSSILRTVQYVVGCIYLLFSRGFTTRKEGRAKYFLSKTLFSLVPKNRHEAVRKKCERQIVKYNDKPCTHLFCNNFFGGLKIYYSTKILESTSNIGFENYEFKTFAQKDEILKNLYGDYLKLPPEEERTWKHRPIYVEVEGLLKQKA